MKHDFSTRQRMEGVAGKGQGKAGLDAANKRSDPRCEVTTQAFVAIASLATRVYHLQELSRGGMFLAFKDPRSTLLELERANIEPGTNVEVAFAVALSDERHRINVGGRIARITRDGVGVRFATRNPPQLAALRELLTRGADIPPAGVPRTPAEPAPGVRKTVSRPEEDTGWQDWELLDGD